VAGGRGPLLRERGTLRGMPPTRRSSIRRGPHPSTFGWTPALVALLGRRPDWEVAARAGISVPTVRSERKRRGLSAFCLKGKDVEWTEAMISRLGTDIDRLIAAELGLHHASVSYKRVLLKIPAFGGKGPPSKVVWRSRALGLLGTASDAQVARRLGLTQAIVRRKRRELGIRPFGPPPKRIIWTPKRLSLLGRRRDTVIARQMGIRAATVLAKRKALSIPPYRDHRPIVRTGALKKLLALSSKEIRARYGWSSHVIAKLRREYGRPAPGRDPGRWTEAVVRRLGREPDTAIARDLGIAAPTVLWRRRRLGIPPFRRARRRGRGRRRART
jgi:hypothetical protein